MENINIYKAPENYNYSQSKSTADIYKDPPTLKDTTFQKEPESYQLAGQPEDFLQGSISSALLQKEGNQMDTCFEKRIHFQMGCYRSHWR